MADENTTAEVDTVETPDLGEMQQAWMTSEIETMLDTAQGAVDGQDASIPDEGENVVETPDETPNVEGRAPGIDTALKFLDENNPDLASVVRAQIRDNNTLRENVKGFETKLQEAVDQSVREVLESQQAEEPVVQEGAYTPEQIEQAKSILREMGVVTKEDLAQEEEKKSLNSYLNDAVASGVQEFGDMFGREEDGKPVLSESALERIQGENQRIQQYGTLHVKDLFILSHFDELIKAAENRGRADGSNTNTARLQKLNGATTATTTSSQTPTPNLRGAKGTQEDSVRAIVMRAYAQAQKKMGL